LTVAVGHQVDYAKRTISQVAADSFLKVFLHALARLCSHDSHFITVFSVMVTAVVNFKSVRLAWVCMSFQVMPRSGLGS
jgi:hypothetical protein